MCDYYRDWVEQGFEVERLRTALTDLLSYVDKIEQLIYQPEDRGTYEAVVKARNALSE
jgi:hypothetical protein